MNHKKTQEREYDCLSRNTGEHTELFNMQVAINYLTAAAKRVVSKGKGLCPKI